MDYKDILSDLAARVEAARTERPTAGTRFRLMGLVADMAEVTEMIQREVLEVVSREAVLEADADMDFEGMAAAVLEWELRVGEPGDQVSEAAEQVNVALGVLSGVLAEVAEQLARRHSDEEYERLYEAEKRRYMASGTARRARQTFEEWRENACYGHPSVEEMDDYRLEKVVHMFERGVMKERVEHIQRAKRYPEELDFEQLDDDHPLRKTVYKHYAALRKLVDWQDGELRVMPARVGQHFYASRHEKNAKQNRSLLLKYMHKVAMVQEERARMEATSAREAAVVLPDVLGTEEAARYWQGLQAAGIVDVRCQLSPGITRKQAMYVADVMSERLQMRSKWKPFQDLWHINNLAQEKWEMQETGKMPPRSDEIDAIFAE